MTSTFVTVNTWRVKNGTDWFK